MGEMLAEASDIARGVGSSLLAVTHFNRDATKKGVDRFTGAGAQEWGRFLIAGTVTTRRRTPEGGSEVSRSVQVSGTSIPDRSFRQTRRIVPVDADDPMSPLMYEVEVTDDPGEVGLESEYPDLDYSYNLVMSILPTGTARTIPELQEAMTDQRPEDKPYGRQTLSTKLNRLEELNLVTGTQDGSAPKRWRRTD
jgi:hypothetical protein